jgi:hypothetical protein
MTPPKIIWRYHYLEKCNIVTPDDIINIKPDEHNRWVIKGYVKMKTKAMPDYEMFGKKILIPMVVIQQKGCAGSTVPSIVDNFCAHFPYIRDANIGFNESYIYGKTPNEVMIKVQESFECTYNCFLNFV